MLSFHLALSLSLHSLFRALDFAISCTLSLTLHSHFRAFRSKPFFAPLPSFHFVLFGWTVRPANIFGAFFLYEIQPHSYTVVI